MKLGKGMMLRSLVSVKNTDNFNQIIIDFEHYIKSSINAPKS